MVGGIFNGRFQLGLRQMSAAQRQQAHRVVIVAQNTIERRSYAWEQWLGFSLVFAKVPYEGLPIYRGFAP
jgi:hypothetical protein